ncbi:hypothetical protein FOMPIDRAFT_1051522 [Fomitopsis schrenkii]|uniref:Uncharacterized protein n=1 Tax=Fomitopsis schrenkii TaxID=2126942 RepID=S8E512_FOMSC|nr:hypothetical protein FOMPIDRAFT_1051522 [Fomitopsis schrenkii]
MPRVKTESRSPSRRASPLGRTLNSTEIKGEDGYCKICGDELSGSPTQDLHHQRQHVKKSEDLPGFYCEGCDRWFASPSRRSHKCLHIIPERTRRAQFKRSRSSFPSSPANGLPPRCAATSAGREASQNPSGGAIAGQSDATDHNRPDVKAEEYPSSPRDLGHARDFWLDQSVQPRYDDMRGATVTPVYLDAPAGAHFPRHPTPDRHSAEGQRHREQGPSVREAARQPLLFAPFSGQGTLRRATERRVPPPAPIAHHLPAAREPEVAPQAPHRPIAQPVPVPAAAFPPRYREPEVVLPRAPSPFDFAPPHAYVYAPQMHGYEAFHLDERPAYLDHREVELVLPRVPPFSYGLQHGPWYTQAPQMHGARYEAFLEPLAQFGPEYDYHFEVDYDSPVYDLPAWAQNLPPELPAYPPVRDFAWLVDPYSP